MSDPKAEKKAVDEVSSSFKAFEKRMQPRLKLIDDLKLKCDLCEQGKTTPEEIGFDPIQALEDMKKQFYKDLMDDEKRLNTQLQNLSKLKLKPSPKFSDYLTKELKPINLFKVGKTEVGFDTKEYVKNIVKGIDKGKVNLKLVPVKVTF